MFAFLFVPLQSQNEANSHHSTFQPISAVKSVGARDEQGQYATSSLPCCQDTA